MSKPSQPGVIDLSGVLSTPGKKKRGLHFKWSKIPVVVWAALIVILLAGAGSLVVSKVISSQSNLTGQAELNHVLGRISRHMLLPSNEVPVLATVTDSTKLTTPFLKKAKDGDQILIYQKNQIAVIYRPSIDRIVAVGPVEIDAPPTVQSTGSGH